MTLLPTTPAGPFTLEEYLALPGEGPDRLELCDGMLVREPPPGGEHGMIAVRLASRLERHAEETGVGRVFVESGYVLWEVPPTVRGPDVSFIALERVPEEGVPAGLWRIPPDLAVEVASASTAADELKRKVGEYLAAGVRLVWVLYPRSRIAEVYRPPSLKTVAVLGMEDALEGEDVLPGFTVRLEEIFRD